MADSIEDLYVKLKDLTKGTTIRIVSDFRSTHWVSPAKALQSMHSPHADCPVCSMSGLQTGRVSSKDPQPTMTILKARQPGMRTLFNILHGPKRKLHKKRSNQTEAYHRRIQKKWDKKWRETHEYSTQPLIMSAGPKLSAFLTEFQSKSRLGRKPKPAVIKEITSEDLDARRAVRKTDAGQLQEGQEPTQDTTGLPGGV